MDQEKWLRIKEIFQSAIQIPENQQAAYLESTCGDDTEVFNEVREMLASHKDDTDFLEAPMILNALDLIKAETESEVAGKQFGAYRIEREISRGGMGVVYLAARADEAFQKQVAIKVLKPGMATTEAINRFHQERQTLAHLDHPNIVKLIDGGTTDDGLPFYIMEYVQGVPLDEYCDLHRLSIFQRLRLFNKIGAAIEYAHRNLIIHRDIKPANILVTGQGEPCLLDFGIAKLLDPAIAPELNIHTQTEQRLMTPEYASPEQVRGQRLNITSDVYSLGVLLYRLLTGHSPYRIKQNNSWELSRAVLEKEPERPSHFFRRKENEFAYSEHCTGKTLGHICETRGSTASRIQRILTGDVDSIVLKAMRKEPKKRYHSVGQLCNDIECFLKGLPVTARKDSFRYRTGKFVKRNKLAIGVACLFVLIIVGGITGIYWQYRIASTQRDIAYEAANTMVTRIAEYLRNAGTSTPELIVLFEDALNIFDQLYSSQPKNINLRRKAASTCRQIAEHYSLLGKYPEALKYLKHAEVHCDFIFEETSVNLIDLEEMATIFHVGGVLYQFLGKADTSKIYFERALKIFEDLPDLSILHPKGLKCLGLVLIQHGDYKYFGGDLKQAAKYYSRSQLVLKSLIEKQPGEADYLSPFATTLERQGDIFYYLGKIDSSCLFYEMALAVRKDVVALQPNHNKELQFYANSFANVAYCDECDENIDDALMHYNEAAEILRKLCQKDPENIRYKRSLMGIIGQAGILLDKENRLEEAQRFCREAWNMGLVLIGQKKSNTSIEKATAEIGCSLTRVYQKQHAFVSAEAIIQKVLSINQKLRQSEPENLDYLDNYGTIRITAGELYLRMGKNQDGLRNYQLAITMYDSILVKSENTVHHQNMVHALLRLGDSLLEEAQPDRARASYSRARDILLALRSKGLLSEATDGCKIYLPEVEAKLKQLQQITEK